MLKPEEGQVLVAGHFVDHGLQDLSFACVTECFDYAIRDFLRQMMVADPKMDQLASHVSISRLSQTEIQITILTRGTAERQEKTYTQEFELKLYALSLIEWAQLGYDWTPSHPDVFWGTTYDLGELECRHSR